MIMHAHAQVDRKRPFLDGRRRFWLEEERAPCGEAGGLTPLCNRLFRYKETWQQDLSDCLVSRPKPFLLVITALAQSHWRDRTGQMRTSKPGFEEWDKIEYRLAWDDVVEFEGERFVISSATVLWKGGRWWMLHDARRQVP